MAVNLWGERFVAFAVPMLWQSSLLIIALFLMEQVLRKRIRPAIRYGLWLLVLVKLMLPPSLSSPTSPAYWLRPDHPTPRPLIIAAPLPSRIELQERVAAAFKAPKELGVPSIRWEGLAALIALVGSLGLSAVLVRECCASRRWVARAIDAPDYLRSLVGACCEQLGVGSKVTVKVSGRTFSPSIYGLWRPVILIPAQLLESLTDAAHLRAVCLHELAHCKRRDVWVNNLQSLLQIVYWWHPLLWLANACIRGLREEVVDEQVMQGLEGAAEAYPLALIEVARLGLGKPLISPSLLGIMETKYTLRRRIANLVNRRESVGVRIGVRGLLLWAAVGLALLPMAQAKTGMATPQTQPATKADAATPPIQPPATPSPGGNPRWAPPSWWNDPAAFRIVSRSFAQRLAMMAQSKISGATLPAEPPQPASGGESQSVTPMGWVSVYGEVRSPGLVALSGKAAPTVLEAIDVRGGLTDVADRNRIELRRHGELRMVASVDQLRQKSREAIALEPGDAVFVLSRLVNVSGEVARPWNIPLPTGQKLTILDAINLAGGLNPVADKNAIEFTRAGNTRRYSLAQLQEMERGRRTTLEPGDLVFVLSRLVSVSGEVARPWNILLEPGQKLTILDAIRLAGGPTRLADTNAVQFTRGGKTSLFSLSQLQATDPRQAIILQAGDLVTISQAQLVMVCGEVMKPGHVRLTNGVPLTLLEALAQAGGPTRQAKNQVVLIRGGGVKKYRYSDLKTLAPINLEPGDTIEVPTSVW